MQIKGKYPILRLSAIAAVAVFTSVACSNNSDYKTSDNAASADTDSIVAGTNKSTTRDVAVQDSNAIQNAQPAGKAESKTTDSKATAHAGAKKRGTTSAVMPAAVAGASTAEFPGGQKALDNYVNDHINYPQTAIDNDVSGVVRVSFVVNESGQITRAKLVGPAKVGNGLDEEALRVVNAMPAWKPAMVHGKKVKTRLELPISFQVES